MSENFCNFFALLLLLLWRMDCQNVTKDENRTRQATLIFSNSTGCKKVYFHIVKNDAGKKIKLSPASKYIQPFLLFH